VGEQLETARRAHGGEFLAVLCRGARCSQASWTRLAQALRADAQAAVAGPAGPGDPERAGLEAVRWLPPDCLLFRRDALEQVGGFDVSFRTAAALDLAVRACRRLGRPALRVWASRLDAAGEPAEEAAARGEREAVRLLEDGDLCRQQGDAAGAEAAYRGAVQAKPDFVEAIMVLASLLSEAGRYAEAVPVYEHLVRLDERSYRAHNCVGLARYRSGELDAARRSFERALELNARDVEVLVNLSVLEWSAGRPEQALDRLEQAAALDPGSRDVVINTALMQAQLGNVDAGVGLLRRYADEHPGDTAPWEALLDLHLRHGRREAAVDVARRLLQVQPEHVRARAVAERANG
jgi:tetratricopeptide (TPR) repeat protein